MSEPELPFAINSVCWRHPVKVIVERDSGALADEITEIATEKKAEKIVLGLPKNMDGSEGFRARLVGNWQSLFQKGLIFR